MHKLFIDISPGFYKTKLLTEISKQTNIIVIYTSDYDTTSRNDDFLKGERVYPHTYLSGNKLKQALIVLYILLTTKYDECIVGGYVCLSDWIPILFCPKRKNTLILESTFRETQSRGPKALVKRFFFSRLNRVYACGTPHEKLARMFGFKGEVIKWNSVGLINTVPQPEFQKRHKVKNFLFVGRLIWQKNISWLIERFKNHPELTLTIIGFGEEETKLRQQATTENIHFLGAVENKLLSSYYQEADVFILPSISETWGLVVEEALNNGTPVMLSHMVGAADDLVIELGTGVVFQSADEDDFEHQLSVITDTEKYNVMRQRISMINFQEREQVIVQKFLNI